MKRKLARKGSEFGWEACYFPAFALLMTHSSVSNSKKDSGGELGFCGGEEGVSVTP